MGASGQSIAVLTGTTVWLSTDYGASFVQKGTAPFSYGFKISNTGQYMICLATAGNTSIGVSADYGQTWTTFSGASTNGYSAVSDSGQYMCISYHTSTGPISVSNNYGASGSWVNVAATPTYGVCMSHSGQYMLTNSNTVSPHYSSNYGVSFTAFPTNAAFGGGRAVFMSGDGTSLIIGTNTIPTFWYTIDGGTTIVSITLPAVTTASFVINEDGSEVYFYSTTTGKIHVTTDLFVSSTALVSVPANNFLDGSANAKYLLSTNTATNAPFLVTNTIK